MRVAAAAVYERGIASATVKRSEKMNRRTLSHFTGCLLGGAVGDALGWPVEFMGWEEVKSRYGGEGSLL